MRSRQVSLRRLRWRTTPGSFEPGARRLWAIASRAETLSSIGVQPSSAAAGAAALAAPAAGLITARICPPSTVSPTASAASAVTTPAQGAWTDVSIFMALTTNSRSPAFTAAPSRALTSTTEPACGLSMASCPVGTGSGRPGGALAHRGRVRGLPPAGRGTAAHPTWPWAVARALGQQRGARVAGPELGMRQDGAQLVAVGRHADDLELVERAAACGRPPRRRCPRSPTGR